MAIDYGKIQSAVGLALSLAGAGMGVIMWWRGAIQKSYAAERDFNHLKRNQENLALAVRQVDDEVKELRDEVGERAHQMSRELVEIKSLLLASMTKNGDSFSAILGKRE